MAHDIYAQTLPNGVSMITCAKIVGLTTTTTVCNFMNISFFAFSRFHQRSMVLKLV